MLTLLEAPTPFVTVPRAKAHLSVSHSRDDAMIEAQIKSAIGFLDGPSGYLGSAIASQKWRFTTGAFNDPLRIPIGPIISVDEVRYKNTANATVIMDLSTVYVFGDASSPYLRPIGQFPADVQTREDAITVDLTVGRSVVPDQLVSAVLLIVGQLYRWREIDVDTRNFPTSFGMFDLAHPYRAY